MGAISHEAKFRQDFPDIIAAVEAAGDHEWIIVESYATRVGTGLQTSVIFRNLTTARGFGCVWRIDAKRLEGCAGRTFSADRPDCRQSKEFLEEFQRRLGCEGATLAAITHGMKISFRANHKQKLKAAIARRCY